MARSVPNVLFRDLGAGLRRGGFAASAAWRLCWPCWHFSCPRPGLALQAQEVSDDALYDQVMRALVRDQVLKIDELMVEVKSGVVTVHGYVKSEKLLERVERVAKRPKGVREVVNKVGVRP